MSGIYVRKVQKIGGQNIVNIPRAICAHLGIQRGDLVAYTEIEDKVAIILKVDHQKIAAFRRQEGLEIGEGKTRSGSDEGSREGGKLQQHGGDVSSSGGSSGATSGDRGQVKLHAGLPGAERGGDKGGSEKGAGAEDGADKPDDNTRGRGIAADKAGLKLIDDDAGPIDGNVIE